MSLKRGTPIPQSSPASERPLLTEAEEGLGGVGEDWVPFLLCLWPPVGLWESHYPFLGLIFVSVNWGWCEKGWVGGWSRSLPIPRLDTSEAALWEGFDFQSDHAGEEQSLMLLANRIVFRDLQGERKGQTPFEVP